jgi:hypothetical protein
MGFGTSDHGSSAVDLIYDKIRTKLQDGHLKRYLVREAGTRRNAAANPRSDRGFILQRGAAVAAGRVKASSPRPARFPVWTDGRAAPSDVKWRRTVITPMP